MGMEDGRWTVDRQGDSRSANVRVALARKTVMCQVVAGCGMVRCDLKRRRMGMEGVEGRMGWDGG